MLITKAFWINVVSKVTAPYLFSSQTFSSCDLEKAKLKGQGSSTVIIFARSNIYVTGYLCNQGLHEFPSIFRERGKSPNGQGNFREFPEISKEFLNSLKF